MYVFGWFCITLSVSCRVLFDVLSALEHRSGLVSWFYLSTSVLVSFFDDAI